MIHIVSSQEKTLGGTLRETVVREVSSLQHWVNANKLTINFDPQKSCFSIFKPLNSQLPESSDDDGLQIIGNTLTRQDKATNLGLVLDHNLSSGFHIHDLNKISSNMQVFSQK